jgi:hypothetical protein
MSNPRKSVRIATSVVIVRAASQCLDLCREELLHAAGAHNRNEKLETELLAQDASWP